MTDNITQDVNFNNVTISNDYPCLVGGNWTASVNSQGKTVYSDGNTTYEGPVNLIGGTLTIMDGAVVTDLIAVNTPTITVNSGGTLDNSDIFSANLIVNTGGLSENNNYVSSNITFRDKSTSSNDSFYYPGTTQSNSGTLNLSQLPSGTSTSFQTSNGKVGFTTGNGLGKGVIFNNPHFPNISANNPNAPASSYQTIRLGPGSQLGNANLVPTTDYSNGKFVLTNENPVYIGGTWTASVGSDGVTYYTATRVSYSSTGKTGSVGPITGPINLINVSGLTIQAGATVDGLTMTQNSGNPTILNYGTIQNSFVANGYLNNQKGGVSKNNTYVSQVFYNYSGATTSGDMWFSGVSSYAKYNLSQMPANGPTQMLLDDGLGNISLYNGSIWDNSYAGTDPNASSSRIYFYRYYGSDVASSPAVCFLSGTMIKTINGYVSIEDIQIGDKIITYNTSQQENRSVIWKGYNHVTVNPALDREKAGYPIRIIKNAISDGVPYKDLLITSEHCLFFNGHFIPAYMLVNDYTIFYDYSITQYTYYHIETENHSVINADGLLTESYLDTGNRHGFYQDQNIISIHNKKKVWNIDSAAPLATHRKLVEPVFDQIVNHIKTLGISYIPKTVSTTNDNGLHLVTDKGEILLKVNDNQEKYVFRLPPNTNFIKIISKTSKPSDVVGPFIADRRNLGVLVGNINLLQRRNNYEIKTHLSSRNLSGWDKEMPQNCRWTNGVAYLELPATTENNYSILVIQVIAGGPYLVQNKTEQETQLIPKAG